MRFGINTPTRIAPSGLAIGYSDFIVNGKWNVDDVLRPIYEEVSKAIGREFPCPEKGKVQ